MYLALYGPEGSVIFDHPYNAESARGDDYLTAGHKPLRSADYGTCTGEIIRTAHDRHVIGP